MTAAEVIGLLDLRPHPEGGHFRETFRDGRHVEQGRSASTAIYFLLQAGEISRWHRVDAAEVWHWYAGAALELGVKADIVGSVDLMLLGNRLADGERPQRIVPSDTWQQARSLGEWTLAGCTVAPGFTFAGFEIVADRN